MRPIQISIPKPCGENWSEFTPVDGGRHCATCNRCVVDFTEKSDREILEIYRKEGKVCGQFRPDQIDRYIKVPKQNRPHLAAAAAAALGILSPTAQAQPATPLTEMHVGFPGQKSSQAGTFPLQNGALRGRVFDNETKEPLPYATVLLFDGTENIWGGLTDEDGYFYVQKEQIEGHTVSDVRVSSIGYQQVIKTFDPPLDISQIEHRLDDIAIDLYQDEVRLLGDVIIVEPQPLHKRWWRGIQRFFGAGH